jgi:flagellar hook-basal body complex protein FliE
MAISPTTAAAAYARQAKDGLAPGLEPRSTDPGESFAEMLGDAVKGAIETSHTAETMSVKALAGQAELNEVVTAINNAELTLQTAVAIRDRVIQAYQDILRMPI